LIYLRQAVLEIFSTYESFLIESIMRQPTGLNIEMMGRIINSVAMPEEKTKYLQIVKNVLSNPKAGQAAKDEAQSYLDYHKE
jgi:hypothetical protein